MTASLLSWFIAQVLKTIINFILLGKFQLRADVGRWWYAQAHTARPSAPWLLLPDAAPGFLADFAVACVVAIITMHDAMGVRHETGEQAKVLNQMIAQWIDVSEKTLPFCRICT